MEYKNTVTGVVISTSCTINGGDWVPYTQELLNEETKQKPTIEETPTDVSKEAETENGDIEGITKAQIMQELDAFGVEYNKRANKTELYALMMQQGK